MFSTISPIMVGRINAQPHKNSFFSRLVIFLFIFNSVPDVYKRQVDSYLAGGRRAGRLVTVRYKFNRVVSPVAGFITDRSPPPVSYTHLDVYKRQALFLRNTCWQYLR